MVYAHESYIWHIKLTIGAFCSVGLEAIFGMLCTFPKIIMSNCLIKTVVTVLKVYVNYISFMLNVLECTVM